MTHPLDKPEVVNNLFYPRKAQANTHPDKDIIKDGSVKIDDDISIGYRLYLNHSFRTDFCSIFTEMAKL